MKITSSFSRREKLLLLLLTSTLIFSASFSYGAVNQSKVDSIMKMITDGGNKFSDTISAGSNKSERTLYYEKVDAGLGDAVEMLGTVRNKIRTEVLGLSPAYTADEIVGQIIGGVIGNGNPGTGGGSNTASTPLGGGKSCMSTPFGSIGIIQVTDGTDIGIVRVAKDNSCRTQIFRCNNGNFEKFGEEGKSCPVNPRKPFPNYLPPSNISCKSTDSSYNNKIAYSDMFSDFEYAGGIIGQEDRVSALRGEPDGLNPDDFGKYQVWKYKGSENSYDSFRTVAITRVPNDRTRIALGVDPKIKDGKLFPEVKWNDANRKLLINDSGIFTKYDDCIGCAGGWHMMTSAGVLNAFSQCPGDVGDLGNRNTVVLMDTRPSATQGAGTDFAKGAFVNIDAGQPITYTTRTQKTTSFKNSVPTDWTDVDAYSNISQDRVSPGQSVALPGLYTDNTWYMNYAPQKGGTCPATPGNPGYDPTNTTLNALGCVFKRNGGAAGSRGLPSGR